MSGEEYDIPRVSRMRAVARGLDGKRGRHHPRRSQSVECRTCGLVLPSIYASLDSCDAIKLTLMVGRVEILAIP